MNAINTNECRELAEYIYDRIIDDDTWNDSDVNESFELIQPKESNDDFVQTINGQNYVSKAQGIRFVTDGYGKEVEYEIIVKRVR